MSHWYFAYGSNLSTAQMIARAAWDDADMERPRLARLPGYRLAFNMLADDGCRYANIVASGDGAAGDGVLGVLYCCTEEMLARLDIFEEGYERRQVEVTDEAGRIFSSIVYIALPETTTSEGPPRIEYLSIILKGAREQGLPETYVRIINRLAGC
jgi:gamma-glutamylcyclotransferase (GGCT)/AIG2-like uncharacterized protein YtfP